MAKTVDKSRVVFKPRSHRIELIFSRPSLALSPLGNNCLAPLAMEARGMPSAGESEGGRKNEGERIHFWGKQQQTTNRERRELYLCNHKELSA